VNLQLNKREKKILFFVIILIPLVFSLLYFNYLRPKISVLKTKEQQLASNQQLYNAVLEQKNDLQETIEENTEFLQERLPVQPLIDQFILDLEKAELLSNSIILQIGFGGESQTGEGTNSPEDSVTDGLEVNNDSVNTDPQTGETLSTPVSTIPVSLTVESPTYFDLEQFLHTLENLERIVTVESISFSGQSEQQVPSAPINYQVSLSLYYMPGLDDLQNELPKIETGDPANKKNPLN
jgi:type IV pilus assembly protein PilO